MYETLRLETDNHVQKTVRSPSDLNKQIRNQTTSFDAHITKISNYSFIINQIFGLNAIYSIEMSVFWRFIYFVHQTKKTQCHI